MVFTTPDAIHFRDSTRFKHQKLGFSPRLIEALLVIFMIEMMNCDNFYLPATTTPVGVIKL